MSTPDWLSRLVRNQIGDSAKWDIYKPLPVQEATNALSFLINEVHGRLDTAPILIWVRGGFPEVFICLGNQTPDVIFLSSRYLEIVDLVYGLITNKLVRKERGWLAEQNALKILAEISLRRNKPDLALRCFLKSACVGDNRTVVPYLDTGAIGLDMRDYDEAYMVHWFFGLLHEIGHRATLAQSSTSPILLDFIERMLHFLAKHLSFSEQEYENIRNDSEYALHPVNLGKEAKADAFATSQIAAIAAKFMRHFGGGASVDQVELACSLYIYLSIVVLIESCARSATGASNAHSDSAKEYIIEREIRLGVALFVLPDILMTMPGLAQEAAVRNREEWRETIMSIAQGFTPAIRDVESGFARALEFSASSEESLDELFSKVESKRDWFDRLIRRSADSTFNMITTSEAIPRELRERVIAAFTPNLL